MTTLKIAVGVFLGGMAVFATINMPRWAEEHRDERARTIIYSTKVNTVLKTCGKPIKDSTEALTPDITLRHLYYKGPYSDTVMLEFISIDKSKSWNYQGMTDVLSTDETSGQKREKPTDQLFWLPCLDPDRKQ